MVSLETVGMASVRFVINCHFADVAGSTFCSEVGPELSPTPSAATSVLATHQAELGVDAVALHEGHSQTTMPEDAIRLGAGLGGHCRR